MEFLADPNIWIGLITLIILEVVLGIDNLVFIAILATNSRRTSATERALSVCPSRSPCASFSCSRSPGS